MAEHCGLRVKVLDECLVSPPSGSVPETHLPINFFDLFWLRQPPTRRVFFYEFRHPTTHFTHAILPSLKQSLSLALQHFFPFAANLIFPPQPQKPFLLYTPPLDSVPLTIAESDSTTHFHALISDHPKDAKDVYQLFQSWPKSRVLSDGTQVIPLLTLQITVFPYRGLSIGASFLHVAADGAAFHHFIKSWASLSATKDLDGPIPFHDRTVVQDPYGLESTFLGWHWSVAGPIDFGSEPISKRLGDKVRATFLLSKPQIEGVRSWVISQISKTQPLEMESPRFSTFVVTCALVWVSFIISREGEGEGEGEGDGNDDKPCCFAFVADCRNRLGYPIPPGYFGNCVAFCFAEAKKSELLGENGIIVGMKAIGKRVGKLEDGALLKETDEEFSVFKKFVESGSVVFAVAGSPRLGAYAADFGWGRPIKTEVVHIDTGRLFSLGESRNEKGGIEVGLALSTAHMARFVPVWEQNLKLFSCSSGPEGRDLF